MNILITICARGGSKGIPGKNIKPLNDKPLIGYSIDVAKEFQTKFERTDIALSTDSEEKRELRYDYILDLDVTSPLRNIGSCKNCRRRFSC